MAYSEWPPSPRNRWKKLQPIGRRCEDCGALLSQYNRDTLCSPCQRKPQHIPEEYVEDLNR